MDYVFGLITSGNEKVICGIWSEYKYAMGAAADIMAKCVSMAISRGAVDEALEIIDLIHHLDKEITEETFKTSETEGLVSSYQLDHFIFSFMTMPALKKAMEDEDSSVVVGAGGDHRKCVESTSGCTHTPTAEQLENGWVPWETEEVKS